MQRLTIPAIGLLGSLRNLNPELLLTELRVCAVFSRKEKVGELHGGNINPRSQGETFSYKSRNIVNLWVIFYLAVNEFIVTQVSQLQSIQDKKSSEKIANILTSS